MPERLWPDLAELEDRRDATKRQIDARNRTLNGRWDRGEAGSTPTLFDLKAADIVLRNLHTRLETYEVDIVRMRRHGLKALEGAKGARSWLCECGTSGGRPTAYGAINQWQEHVMQEVWGA